MKTRTNSTRSTNKWLALCLLLSVSVALSLGVAAGQQSDKSQTPPAKAAPKKPTLLLTGFEPFGKGKPPNPSWEAIKDLDGKDWKEYKLFCRQLPVVWGSPLEKLPVWIAECEPTAIFSFGQGGGFTVESKASNSRGGSSDNNGKKAPNPLIAKDGAALFKSTTECEKIVDMLQERGWDVRVSTNAGKYLCEECLYSLEYLKLTKKLPGTVMFCHVPPLGREVAEHTVTPAYVQGFVKAVMDSWHTIYHKDAPAAASSEASEPQAGREQDQKDVTELINRYFTTWSAANMKGYDACFLPDACIQHIDDSGTLSTQSRPDFIESQRHYHATSPTKTTEVPESIRISFEAKLARVVVFWKLTAGPRTETGYDHFTLLKHNGNWRIVNLAFYASDKRG